MTALPSMARRGGCKCPPLKVRGSTPYYLAIAVPEAELLVQARQLLQQGGIAIGIILLVSIPITMLVARLVSRPVQALSLEAEKNTAIRFF
jgi:hypothetical protein